MPPLPVIPAREVDRGRVTRSLALAGFLAILLLPVAARATESDPAVRAREIRLDGTIPRVTAGKGFQLAATSVTLPGGNPIAFPAPRNKTVVVPADAGVECAGTHPAIGDALALTGLSGEGVKVFDHGWVPASGSKGYKLTGVKGLSQEPAVHFYTESGGREHSPAKLEFDLR